MERKSIGGFIAALRRERGLTQKELAEQLNVSDKTVSRWERDEGTPDLYLVPVLADIFGVSCDELLRGERAAGQGSASALPVGERTDERAEERPHQRQALLLKAGLTKYENRTLISCGIILLG
ncbi:MAG: helix-turn-helix domain-containing protein, partial [Firmicutes bacterium]|nr:helix-turn-helix domain-containing protein [Bacillota bacterium]